jgi:6-phosphofructokinase 2
MESIVTLTPNPAIDISTSVDEVVPIRKLRCADARRDPGGGGINVARVVRRLGGVVSAIYPAGGATGELLRRLVERERVQGVAIPVAEETREDFTVFDRKSGKQYRFVLPGPPLSEAEWRACLNALEAMQTLPPFIVCSGSLPPGVPDDFYARVARFAKARGSKVVLDTSGEPLASALREGVSVLKPNLRELQELANVPLTDEQSWLAAGRRLIESGSAELIALTLADKGSLLMTRDGALRASVPDVKVVSTVGAGDSFVGGLVWALASGHSTVEAFRWGVAAGTAAVLNPGTELCHADDVARLFEKVEPVDCSGPQPSSSRVR